MKHALAISALTLCTALPAAAQDGALLPAAAASVPRTNVETFLTAHGGLLVKDFYEVGSVSGDGRVDLYAIVFRAPGNEQVQVRGLRVEVIGSGKPAPADSRYLDADEIEALSRGLKYMADVAAQWKGMEKQEYTEIDFTAKDGLRIGFYQRRKSQGAFVSAGEAQVLLEAKDLARLQALADDALRILRGQ